jgi:FAD/FMN-containing dehydrogenase
MVKTYALRRRALVGGMVGGLAGAAALPGWTRAAGQPKGVPAAGFDVELDDASRMNRRRVDHHRVLRGGADDPTLLAALRGELARAHASGRPVVLGAARHSMGAQALPQGGAALTFDDATCLADAAQQRYRAHAGARWHQVIARLDPLGFSPAVMQSNSDFGVAATLCVNAHGWPAPFGPFAETVSAIRLMLADGSVLRCSRDENAELFSLVAGGYGMVGIVLEVEAEMVRNSLLEPTPELMPSARLGLRMAQLLEADRDVRMAYGRLSVAREAFFDEALLVTYRPVPAPDGRVPPAGAGGGLSGAVSRELFRSQYGSEKMKAARWQLERKHNPGRATRNTLMNEPVANLTGRDQQLTDILHEYFVPPERFGEFVSACRDIILAARQELLNVTLRWLAPDRTSVLAYAPAARVAAVMLFSYPATPAADEAMQRMTEALVDRVLAIGGSFYLPYRLHARRDQVERAYPRAAYFAERKQHYDPQGVFRHALWDRYFA